MAPFALPLSNASLSNPPFSVTPATPFQSGNQTQWGPDSIGTIVFGVLMFFMAAVALWQGRQRSKQRGQDTEQGSRNEQSERTANATDPIPMVDLSQGIPAARVAASNSDNEPARNERRGSERRTNAQQGTNTQGNEHETDQAFVPRTGQDMRTDTDWTLVGDDEDDDNKVEGQAEGKTEI